MSNIFASFSTFARHCGPPKMPLEECEICRAIPKSCSRFEKGGDVERDTIPPEASRLVGFLPEIQAQRGEVKRCPICNRMYFYEYEYEFLVGGSEDTYSYERLELDELFRHEWIILQRLGLERVWVQWQHYFPRALVNIDGWKTLDDDNRLAPFTEDAFRTLIAANPRGGFDDVARAKHFAHLVDLASGRATSVSFFSTIRWKKPLTEEERRQIADLEAACGKIEPPVVESHGDRITVRGWVIVDRKLICRVTTIFPDGRFIREDAVIGEHIPVA
jgi:hypothetical protein